MVGSGEKVPQGRELPPYLHPPVPRGPGRRGEGAGLGHGGTATHDDKCVVLSHVLRLISSRYFIHGMPPAVRHLPVETPSVPAMRSLLAV
uniref:Uncharacterized protein n=1 Tax=Oryza meridionalis TaxID=40149 RepID=A0A0E0D5E5_9ORYZ